MQEVSKANAGFWGTLWGAYGRFREEETKISDRGW